MPNLSPFDAAAVLDAYRLHRVNFGGSDRDFLSSKALDPMPSEAWLRRALRTWRTRAAAGLDPLTGKPAASPEDSKALLNALGQPDALQAFNAQKKAERAANLPPSDSPQGLTDSKRGGLQAPEREARRIRKAERIMDSVLAGKDVKPATRAMAVEVLEAAGKLGKQRAKDAGKVSEFTTWPNAAIVDLLNELGTNVLATRHDPAPPVVLIPFEERDAARLEEPAEVPASVSMAMKSEGSGDRAA